MSTIEQKVMASVGVIYTWRRLTSAAALRAYVLMLCAGGIAALVSVSNVLQNFIASLESGRIDHVATFIYVAVTSTALPVQLALTVAIAVLCSFAFDMARRAGPRYA